MRWQDQGYTTELCPRSRDTPAQHELAVKESFTETVRIMLDMVARDIPVIVIPVAAQVSMPQLESAVETLANLKKNPLDLNPEA